jgi:hypothetical protein
VILKKELSTYKNGAQRKGIELIYPEEFMSQEYTNRTSACKGSIRVLFAVHVFGGFF